MPELFFREPPPARTLAMILALPAVSGPLGASADAAFFEGFLLLYHHAKQAPKTATTRPTLLRVLEPTEPMEMVSLKNVVE